MTDEIEMDDIVITPNVDKPTRGFSDVPFASIKIFGSCDFVEEDLYYIIYPERPISKLHRKELKEMGWVLQKHTRTKRDIWIWNKKDVK